MKIFTVTIALNENTLFFLLVYIFSRYVFNDNENKTQYDGIKTTELLNIHRELLKQMDQKMFSKYIQEIDEFITYQTKTIGITEQNHERILSMCFLYQELGFKGSHE